MTRAANGLSVASDVQFHDAVPSVAGLHMPSRASSGALHRLSALRRLVRTQRPATHTSAKNLQRLFNYGVL